MSDFGDILGFEDALPSRLPRPKRAPHVRPPSLGVARNEARLRLLRVASGAPEVMVRVTGRAHDRSQLRAHLDYISRKGELEMEDRDGVVIAGRPAVMALVGDWSDQARIDSARRASTPFSQSMVLSMPVGTDAARLLNAARDFAKAAFARYFSYVLVLHTDAEHPHVHLARRWLGDAGERLDPDRTDLENFRQIFAQALRDHGVEAEATPRWARGVTRKAERPVLRRIREKHEAGKGPPARILRAAYHDAAKAAFQGESELNQWERRLLDRQAKIRSLYLAQAQQLARSSAPADQALGAKVEAFVRSMPPPDSQRLALARELRAANNALRRTRGLEKGDKER